MKKLIKKCCYIFVSAFLSTNTMLSIVSAKTIQENNTTYSIPYNIQCIIKDHNNILTQENKDFLEQVFYNTFDDIWYKYGYSSKEPPIVTFLINDKFVSKDFVGSELGNG